MVRTLASKLVLVLALVFAAVAVPAGVASANTGDGSGGGGTYTIDRPKFTGYQCSLYRARSWPSGQVEYLYNCANGIYVKDGGQRVWGNKCVQHVTGGGWGWYQNACWNI